ncbi:MAG: cytochrome c biogenesis protein CcsA [Desulfovibrionaceae bacterium]
MISFETVTNTILICYAGATCCGLAGMLTRNGPLKKVAAALTLSGFLIQTVSLALGSHMALPGGLSWGAYLQLIAWFVVLCSLIGWWRVRDESATLFAAPLALIIFLFSHRFLLLQVKLPESLTAYFYALHIGTLFLSLGLMALAFVAGLIFLQLERKIKTKARLKGFQKDFPALSILDKINSITTLTGFPLYTIGLISGFAWARPVFGTTISGDPKEIISIVAWLLYAWLFHMRLSQGWRGRKPALLAVWLFGLSVFSILVVNSFADTHHAFTKRQ